ncbi:MAG: RagB/SusD family nutrient uptake outer membrane protein [Cytophagales bacterium]|nr:RagB/SusD family nutrient uptake outer membrane protein [Cytophagales bacterium]
MKNIFKYCIVIVFVLTVTSCEDFLEKQPLDQISSETFWKTPEDVEMGVIGVYSRLQSTTFNYFRMNWDAMSDNAYQRHNHQNILTLAQGNVEATSGGIVNSIYSDCYRGISACNIFLEEVENVEMDESLKNRYKGEVLFLRALFYFTLTEFYGGVPIYTLPVTVDDAIVKQASKTDVISQVLSDLDFAISNLPAAPYSGNAVKGSAMALKAKVLMHNDNWSEAAGLAKQIIDGNAGEFSLSDDYRGLFISAGQSNNPEIMFSTKYLGPDNVATWGQDIEFGWWNSLQPMQALADAYEDINGLPIDDPNSIYDPNDPKANRDPRFDYTIRLEDEPVVRSDGYEWNGGEGTFTGMIVRKGMDEELVPLGYAVVNQSDADFVVMRYAEVLLMYAECQNEANGPDQSIYDAVNEIRTRPSVNMPPLPTGLSKDQMRERIRHERQVELGLEGLRYWDLKRWGTAETVIPTIMDPGDIQRQFDPSKHYLFPFPLSETDINTELDQNPGY